MRTLLTFATITLSLFTAIGLACAVRIALRPTPVRRDPYLDVIGDVPGFSAEQLRAISRHSMSKIEQDEQRRSFAYGNTRLSNPRITRKMIDEAAERIAADQLNSPGESFALRPADADGVGESLKSPRAHAVRSFFRGWRHA